MEVVDRLEVKILSGDNLPVIDNILPSSYVEVIVGPNSRRTKPFPESTNPVWNSTTMIFDQILANGTDAVIVNVKHSDLFTGKDMTIGTIAISLATALNAPGIDIEDDYPLMIAPGMTFRPSGSLRIVMAYFNTVDEDISAAAAAAAAEATNPPNLLQIRVVDSDFSSTSAVKGPIEAFVIAQVGDLRKQTQVSKKSLQPAWDDLIEIPVTDGQGNIEITVKHTQLLRSVFIGRVRIPINEVASCGDVGLRKEYALLNENFEFLERGNGHLNLNMKWIFDSATDEESKKQKVFKPSLFSSITSRLFRQQSIAGKTQKEIMNPLLSQDDDDDDEEDENELTANMSPQELQQYYDEKRKKRTEELEKLLEKPPEYDEAIIKEGDYIVQVHIIDVADIKGYNMSGLSDPFCVLEVFGQRQRTRFVKDTSSAFFDETFYFNFKDLKREQIAEGTLKISVYDHNYIRSNDLIGIYQVDLQTIYNKPDHELYRHVAALRNPQSKDAVGSQGVLKFSAVVLGPGDAQKVHDPAKEDDEEVDLEITEGIFKPDAGDGLAQTLQFLVISVIKVEGLPGYDRIISSIKNGLYAYIKLEFAGVKPIKTSKIFVSGKKNLSVSFEEELWIPVWTPTMCRKAKLTIFNREFGRRDLLIATAYVDFDDITKLDNDPIISGGIFNPLSKKKYNGPSFRWVHLFGANPLVRGSTQAANFMNRFPSYGSAYRGSILMSARLIKNSDGNNLAHRVSMNYDIPDSLLPKQSSFMLRVMIYQGSDFGNKGNQSRGREGSYALGISIGAIELKSAFRTYTNGAVDWIQLIEMPSISLPADPAQVPDTIITVYKGSETSYTSVAYKRLNTIELLHKQTKSDATWHELSHDQSHKSVSTIGYPGAALLKMALVNLEEVDSLQDWESERKKLENKKPYCLRVYLYQAKNLPSVDDNGMIDPYVKVRFAGQKKKSQIRNSTQNPTYYEVLTFTTMLPQDLTLAPNVLLQVWDYNGIVNGRIPIAAVRQRVLDIPLHKSFQSPIPEPKWTELHGIDGKGNMGEVLVSFQLIEMKNIEQIVPIPDDITPKLRKVHIDFHIIGLRDLTKGGKSKNISKPSLQFDVASQSYGESFQIGGVRNPSPFNPNYLHRQTAMIQLPEDPLFSPILEVKVLDERYNGKVLLGVTNISLNNKLPWNGDEYIPPRQHMILEENMKKQQSLLKKRQKKKGEKSFVKPQQGTLSAAELNEADEDHSVVVSKKAIADPGLGIFPPDENFKDGGKYAELPRIIDDDEIRLVREEKERRLAMKKSKKGKSDQGFNLFDFDMPSNDAWKKEIKFPTSWTSTDFLTGREGWINSTKPGSGGNLENYLETYPFENYEIFSGHVAFNKYGRRKDTKRKVGILKAVIRVCLRNPILDEEYNTFAKSIKAVNDCVVRLYIIKAVNLQPTSYFNSKANPYIKVTLGDHFEKDLKSMNKNTLNPEFYSYYEFTTKIPGPSTLKLQIFDHKNFFGTDICMGETIIDCEDRFFHPKWTALGDVKPVEGRNLTKVGSQTTQGVVSMWLEILTVAEAQNIPPTKIAGPEKQRFEIRVICWRSKNVTYKRGIKDLFGLFYMEGEGQERMKTDVHWRCKTGTASWNYRIKIPIELPIKSRELGRLHVQLYNQSIITSNEIVGENIINLYDWLLLAYHRKNTVSPFKEKRDAIKKVSLGFGTAGTDSINIAEETGSSMDDDDDDFEDEPEVKDNDDDDDDFGMHDVYAGDDRIPLLGDPSESKGLTKRNKEKVAIASPVLNESQKGKEGVKGDPSNVDSKKYDDKDEEPEDEASEIKKLVDQVNVFLGLGDSLAEDAEWIDLTYNDHNTGKKFNRGSLAVSVSIVPESEAKSRPVGTGRDEPNVNPYLPPPFGRFAFSFFNPLSMISGICGTQVLVICLCVLCCLCIFGCFFFISTYLSGIEATINLLKG